jgi:hypothetical protein
MEKSYWKNNTQWHKKVWFKIAHILTRIFCMPTDTTLQNGTGTDR